MTIQLYLGTSKSRNEVFDIVNSLDFRIDKLSADKYGITHLMHTKLSHNLSLKIHDSIKFKEPNIIQQVNNSSMLNDIKNVMSEIEFLASKDPKKENLKITHPVKDSNEYVTLMDPNAIKVLNQLYIELPDLIYYHEFRVNEGNGSTSMKLDAPKLSHLFEYLKKREK